MFFMIIFMMMMIFMMMVIFMMMMMTIFMMMAMMTAMETSVGIKKKTTSLRWPIPASTAVGFLRWNSPKNRTGTGNES